MDERLHRSQQCEPAAREANSIRGCISRGTTAGTGRGLTPLLQGDLTEAFQFLKGDYK